MTPIVKIRHWPVWIACLGWIAQGAARADTAFIQNGKALGSIVTPKQPSKAEQFAAEEIQTYLEKITGAKPALVNGDIPADQPAIVIGDRPETEAVRAELQKKKKSHEGFAIVGQDNRLFLVGNGPTATVYAAWDWLESLGVRWIMPTERGVYVPHRDTIQIKKSKKYDAPAMDFRGPNYAMLPRWTHPEDANTKEHDILGSLLLTYRWRMNQNLDFDETDAWAEVGSGHSFAQFLPVATYYKEHPEWYNLINGKRNSGNDWQLCFTNREAAAQFAKNISREIEAHIKRGQKPERMRVWVSPNDGIARCDCDNCKALLDNNGAATSLVVHFANMVAEEVHKTYPKARIVFYAYANYASPPEKERPGPNVCPEITFWTAATAVRANNAHPMFSAENDRFRTYFRQWAQIADAVSVYQYYGHWVWFTPWPQVTQIAYDFPRLVEEGKFYGITSEDHLHWGTQVPHLYLAAKMRWNPGLDVERTMDEFYKAAFGPAADAIQSYFEILQKKMDSLPYISGNTTEIISLLTPEIIAACNDQIDRAASATSRMDENTKWRTNIVVNGWKMSAKIAEALRLYVAPGNTNVDRTRIAKAVQEIDAFLEKPEGRWTFEKRIVDIALKPTLYTMKEGLDALPVGEHLFNDGLSYGGSLKFYGTVTGLRPGLYGYALPASAQGVIEVPLKAADGRKFRSCKIRIGWAVRDPAKVRATVTVVGADGAQTTLANSLTEALPILTLPNSIGGEAKLRIVCDNLTGQSLDLINGFTVASTVE